jgi:peptidyl-prolyl cis-trans isomerase C
MRLRPLLTAAALAFTFHVQAADPPASPPADKADKSAARADKLPMTTPLVTDGTVVVDKADFEGSLLRIPEVYRAEVRMSPDRVSTLIDSVFVTRVLANRAKAAGLDKDPAVQKRLQQIQEGFLAELYRAKVEKDMNFGNLEQRARELYQADRASYVMPEQVYIQQILVSEKGRTPEMARARAQEAYEAAKSGKEEFLSYALTYSDEEPPRGGTRGDIGWGNPKQFVQSVGDAVEKLKKGEISPPIESPYGFHVIKLVDRKPAHQLSFDEVKDKIIAQEKGKLVKAKLEAILGEIRASPTATVHKENVDALIIPVDIEKVKRAQEAPAK